jgi:hypothetical protein
VRDLQPTAEEQRAIRALKTVARTWPRSIWLYSASGRLCVMRALPDGSPALKGESVDPDYLLDTIDIPNDGGDW